MKTKRHTCTYSETRAHKTYWCSSIECWTAFYAPAYAISGILRGGMVADPYRIKVYIGHKKAG